MAPEIVQKSTAVASEDWEKELAHRAVSRQTEIQPGVPARDIAEALLARLLEEKRARRKHGLDHWHEHASEAAERLLQEVRAEARHKAELAVFLDRVRQEALAFARSFLDREEDAEDAVAEAFERLAAGKTKPAHFFRTLKHVAVDKFRRLERERQMFQPHPALLSDGLNLGAAGADGAQMQGGGTNQREPIASGIDGIDPLDLLCHQEEVEAAMKLARTDRRYWWIRQKKWGQDLGLTPLSGGAVNDSACSNE